MHQYNFPPYCTGEVGRMGAPKRREIGHGALAERALLPVLPSEDEFPYAIRVVSEVLESNGSSSMASTCGSTLALMDAGVPIKAPVSGIAMGLIKEGDDVVILSDIQGHRGLPGRHGLQGVPAPTKGITALQMDNKAKGLSVEILARALKQAKRRPRLHPERHARADSRPRARSCARPRPASRPSTFLWTRSATSSASGGKAVRGIQEETGASIDIQEDGTMHIAAVDRGMPADAAQAHDPRPS